MPENKNRRKRGNADARGRQQSLPLTWDVAESPESQEPVVPPAADPAGDEPTDTEIAADEPADSERVGDDDDVAEPAAEPGAISPSAVDGEAEGALAAVDSSIGTGMEATLSPEPKAPRVVKLAETAVSLGQSLAEARGACNLTLAQVCQKTRIPKNIVEPLETDRFDLLPPPIYMRSHISHLCELYGIDAEPMLREYDRLAADCRHTDDFGAMVVTSEPAESGAKVRYRLAGPPAPGGSRTPGRVSRWLVGGAIGLLIILVVAALGVQQWRHRPRPAAPAAGNRASGQASVPVDLEQFVIPQQLPLKELPVPEE